MRQLLVAGVARPHTDMASATDQAATGARVGSDLALVKDTRRPVSRDCGVRPTAKVRAYCRRQATIVALPRPANIAYVCDSSAHSIYVTLPYRRRDGAPHCTDWEGG